MEDVNKKIKSAVIQKNKCVACGACISECPKSAIRIINGSYAEVDKEKCVGCGLCKKVCAASAIKVGNEKKKDTKHWWEYLWIASAMYIFLGFFNILFAWLGLLCFFIPLIISIFKGSKAYCNKYCGRGQLFTKLGKDCNISLKGDMPKFLNNNWFRYGFLIFFLTMFTNMIFITISVFSKTQDLRQFVTLFWTFKLPWDFAYNGIAIEWIAQFAFGFYSIMLTSTLIGIIMMILFKPRSWCVICPMGTMTQLICKIKNRKNEKIR